MVNLPVRGIGAKTIEQLRNEARAAGVSLWQTAAIAGVAGAKPAIQSFIALIERLAREVAGRVLHEQIDHVIQSSGLIEHFKKDKTAGEGRIENLEELVSAARGFDPDAAETGSTPATDEALPPLEAFLAHAVLESGEGQADAWEDCIQMMSLHSAKGLEFPIVFMCGLEDGLFPHTRSMDDIEGLEEERRLCYVGCTRAMKQLYITYAEQRRLHGTDSYAMASRFLKEIPEEFVEELRPRVQVSRPVVSSARFRAPEAEPAAPGVKLGARVRHGKFGDGVILSVEGQGAHARVQVNFEGQGSKWLMLQYANLTIV